MLISFAMQWEQQIDGLSNGHKKLFCTSYIEVLAKYKGCAALNYCVRI